MFHRYRPLFLKVFDVYLTLAQISNIMLFAWMIVNVGYRFQVMNEKIQSRLTGNKINSNTVIQFPLVNCDCFFDEFNRQNLSF